MHIHVLKSSHVETQVQARHTPALMHERIYFHTHTHTLTCTHQKGKRPFQFKYDMCVCLKARNLVSKQP